MGLAGLDWPIGFCMLNVVAVWLVLKLFANFDVNFNLLCNCWKRKYLM